MLELINNSYKNIYIMAKKSFKSLPKRAKRAAFASMQRKGKLKRKGKNGKRTGKDDTTVFNQSRRIQGKLKQQIRVLSAQKASNTKRRNHPVYGGDAFPENKKLDKKISRLKSRQSRVSNAYYKIISTN